jgi:hypothetical protein
MPSYCCSYTGHSVMLWCSAHSRTYEKQWQPTRDVRNSDWFWEEWPCICENWLTNCKAGINLCTSYMQQLVHWQPIHPGSLPYQSSIPLVLTVPHHNTLPFTISYSSSWGIMVKEWGSKVANAYTKWVQANGSRFRELNRIGSLRYTAQPST